MKSKKSMEKDIPKFDLQVDYLVGEGFEKDLIGYLHFPCRIESGFFILCKKGTMRVTINANEYSISANDLITLPPHYFIEIHECSKDVHVYYAGFSSQFVESVNLITSTGHLLPVIMENPVVALSPTDAHSYELFYQSSIFSYVSPRSRVNKEIIKAVFTMFIQGATEIYKMRKNWDSPVPSRKYEVYQDFMKLVMKHYATQHSAAFYAEQLGLSLPHFCSTIKKATGNTPLEVIASIILMEAKARLKSTSDPVKNIALALGFGNLSFFNKFFKQHVGITPQEYREDS